MYAPVWGYQYMFSHLISAPSLYINHAAKVRELVDFLYLVAIYSDLPVPFTSSAYPFGLLRCRPSRYMGGYMPFYKMQAV